MVLPIWSQFDFIPFRYFCSVENVYYISIVFEAAIVLASLIFTVLLISTKVLPEKVARNGVLLFLVLSFIALFYMIINLGWVHIAIPLVWLFVPASISVGLFFYRFNTIWMGHSFKLDRYLASVPILVMMVALSLEILHSLLPQSNDVRIFRLFFTENTLRYLFPVYSGVLIAMNWVKIRRAEAANRDVYATDFLVNLNWSRIALLIYLIFYLGVVTSELVNPYVAEFTFNISILTLVLYLGYYQIKVISRYLEEKKEQVVSTRVTSEAEILREENPELDNLYERINRLVDEEKLFLQQAISIHELGVRFEMNAKYLSQAINHQAGLNFNKFINTKRVNYAATLILDDNYSHLSLEGIANESGFRSKSTFNGAFKEVMNCTPSEYKKRKAK